MKGARNGCHDARYGEMTHLPFQVSEELASRNFRTSGDNVKVVSQSERDVLCLRNTIPTPIPMVGI